MGGRDEEIDTAPAPHPGSDPPERSDVRNYSVYEAQQPVYSQGLISSNRRLCALLVENQPVDFEHVLSQVVRGGPVIVVVVDVDNFHGAATPVVDGEGAEKEGVFWGGDGGVDLGLEECFDGAEVVLGVE